MGEEDHGMTSSTLTSDNGVIDGLNNGTYYAQVISHLAVGTITSECSIDFIIVDKIPPVDNIANFQFIDSFDIDGDDISVSWTAFTDNNAIANHRIKTFTNSTCNAGEVDHGLTDSDANTNNTIINNLVEATHYGQVTAIDVAGNETTSSCSTDSIIVDFTFPSVQNIIAPANSTYGQGSSLDFQLVFNEVVTITGVPCIDLIIGATSRKACYSSGTSSTTLIFRYIVQAGDFDVDGVSLGNSISLEGGSIVDSASLNADLDISSSLPDLSSVLVNTATVPPSAINSLFQTNLSNDRTQASFTWTTPNNNGTPITKYVLRYRKVGAATFLYLNPDPVTTNATIMGLDSEGLYEVQVAAFSTVLGAYSPLLNVSTFFNPKSLGALIWYEAKDINGNGAIPADGTSITTFTDKSGNSNNATKISGASATIQTEQGYKVIRLDSSGYRTISSLGETANTDLEVFIVAKTRQITNSFAFVNENQGNTNRYGTHFPWGDGTAYVDLTIQNRFSGAWGGNTSDFFAWSFRSSTTQARSLQRNGVTILSAGNKTNTAPLKKWTIGSRYAGSGEFWKADMQAIFVFNKILTAQQRLDFFQYVEDEYGVSMP